MPETPQNRSESFMERHCNGCDSSTGDLTEYRMEYGDTELLCDDCAHDSHGLIKYKAEDEYLYLVSAACSRCGKIVDHVERTTTPIGMMQDVPISTTYCPFCGVNPDHWDIHEEARIKRAPPAEEEATV